MPLCNGEDACQLYAKGQPISGASSCNAVAREGRIENKMQRASFELLGGALC